MLPPVVSRAVFRPQRQKPAEPVEILHVLFRRQQRLVFVLPVDVDQQPAAFPQHRNGRGPPVDAAAAFSLGGYRALDEQHAVLVGFKPELPQLVLRRGGQIAEHGGHRRLPAAGAHQVPADPLAEHRVDRIDNNGFARTGFAGQHVEAGIEGDVGLFDHRDIFNMQTPQHKRSRLPPSCPTGASSSF